MSSLPFTNVGQRALLRLILSVIIHIFRAQVGRAEHRAGPLIKPNLNRHDKEHLLLLYLHDDRLLSVTCPGSK